MFGLAVSTVLSLVIVPVFYALLVIIRDRVWGSDPTPPAGTPEPVAPPAGH